MDEVDWGDLLDTRLLRLTGITLALPGNPQALVLEAARRAHEAGVPVSYDVTYRARLWSPEEAQRVTLPLVADVDVLCGSFGRDVLVAGVLHGVLGSDFARGLRDGAVCAAPSLGQLGDRPSVDADELDRLVDAPGGRIER